MTILNTIKPGLQPAYNLVGATGLRAGVAIAKIGMGFLINDGTMMGAGFTQGILGFVTSSLVGDKLNTLVASNWATPAVVVMESAVINGLSYGHNKTNAFMHLGYNLIPVSLKLSSPSITNAKINVSGYLKMAGLIAVDALTEVTIACMEQDDSSALDAVIEGHTPLDF